MDQQTISILAIYECQIAWIIHFITSIFSCICHIIFLAQSYDNPQGCEQVDGSLSRRVFQLVESNNLRLVIRKSNLFRTRDTYVMRD